MARHLHKASRRDFSAAGMWRVVDQMRISTCNFVRAVIVIVLSMLGSGCAAIRPWDRDLLAEKKMRFIPNPMSHEVDEHIYFSKEGSMGGQDVGGGGCGCN